MFRYRLHARVACLAYLRLRGQLWALPPAHPAQPTLAAAVASADRRWRTLATATREGHGRARPAPRGTPQPQS